MRIGVYKVKNCDVKNVKICVNHKKKSTFHYKTIIYSVHSQNLTLNIRNFISGFFPDFPNPVFSRKKSVGELGRGKTFHHFIAHLYLACFLYELKLEHNGAYAKNDLI